MEGRPRDFAQPPGAFTAEAAAALRALAADPREPVILGYHPIARMNPYQSLLYGSAWTAAIAALPIVREERIEELAALARLGIRTVLHLHWLNQVLAHVDSPKEADKAIGRFLGRLDAYRDAGGRLAWTIHNILPHGARLEAEEARLSAAVVERCEVVHVMAPGTLDHVGAWFPIPAEKVLSVPHASYLGAYEDAVTRAQARHELGIMPDEHVYVTAGAIRPYKGLPELLDAWDAIAGDGVPRRLVIAGGPTDEPGIGRVLERAAIHPTVLLHARRIPGEEMQLFLRAADVAVLPYLRSLNSGALMLALTFGLPVVVPAGGGLAEAVDERFARSFDPGDGASLADALRASSDLMTPEAHAAARALAEARRPGPISERFAAGLRERLGIDAT